MLNYIKINQINPYNVKWTFLLSHNQKKVLFSKNTERK